jgi:ADP-ribose pyrophosphatase YjhB (NUDIX family)
VSSLVTDALWRSLLRAAYRVMRLWWAIRRPEAHGAFVAAWQGERLLLVRNSYRSGESVPCGHIRRSESPREGAARELREEVGLVAALEELVPAGVHAVEFEGKYDHAHFFEWRAPTTAMPRIDEREVVHAEWVEEQRLAERPLLPHTRAYLDARSRRAEAGSVPPDEIDG